MTADEDHSTARLTHGECVHEIGVFQGVWALGSIILLDDGCAESATSRADSDRFPKETLVLVAKDIRGGS